MRQSLLKHIASHFPRTILKLRTAKRIKKWPDFKNPSTIFELMMNNAYKNRNNKLWGKLADKIDVHEYIARQIGEEYLTTIYRTYDSADDVDFKDLPESFVLKTNNGCGTNFVIKDKNKADEAAIKKALDKWLKYPYGQLTGQLHYTHMKPRILAEKLLDNDWKQLSSSIVDYKFLCVGGEPLFLYVCYNRRVNHHMPDVALYDMQGNAKDEYLLKKDYPPVPFPKSFEHMKKVVAKLAEPFDLVRIDMYEVNGKPVFGEYTFTPGLEWTNDDFSTYVLNKYKAKYNLG